MTNKDIADRIRSLGRRIGLLNDSQITSVAKCYPGTLIDMTRVKTSPRLDTLQKFAEALHVEVCDLITESTEADMDLSHLLRQLSEYEKTKVAVYIEGLIANREPIKKVA